MNVYYVVVNLESGYKERIILNDKDLKSAKETVIRGLEADGLKVKDLDSAMRVSKAKAGKLQDEGVRCWTYL